MSQEMDSKDMKDKVGKTGAVQRYCYQKRNTMEYNV